MRSNLRIEIVVPPSSGPSRIYTRLLVDDVDVASKYSGIGADPDRLIGRRGALTAEESPHDAYLADGDCVEECCGALRAQIWRDGEEIIWDQLRHTGGGNQPDVSMIRFDAAEYDAELARADRERSWEQPHRTIARLLRDKLHDDPDVFAQWDSDLDWVSAWEPDYVHVAFWSPRGVPRSEAVQHVRRIAVTVTADPATQADDAFAELSEDDPRQRA